MAGIYIHIPYCRKACHYCNFHFSTNLKEVDVMVKAIMQEIELRKNYLPHSTIQTIYFGGGTPGVLSIENLKQIIEKLYTHFDISINAEVTIEVNPDDMTEEYLLQLHELGINRLSIGTQSFFEEDLLYMNRSHTAKKSIDCLKVAQDVGFSNLSLDLIYGYPLLTNKKWLSNLQQAIEFNITHLSCYAMTVEDKTALWHFVKAGKEKPMYVDQQAEQFEILMQWAKENKFEHYEISNLCKKGHRAVHNSNYWKGEAYLGIGPSAHSYDGYVRQWNVSNNAIYTKSILQNVLPIETEVLSSTEKLNEYIMISLRTIEGINLNQIKRLSTPNEYEQFITMANKVEKNGTIYIDEENIILTPKGKLLADKVSVDLFF